VVQYTDVPSKELIKHKKKNRIGKKLKWYFLVIQEQISYNPFQYLNLSSYLTVNPADTLAKILGLMLFRKVKLNKP
jgi:hypothetical protein